MPEYDVDIPGRITVRVNAADKDDAILRSSLDMPKPPGWSFGNDIGSWRVREVSPSGESRDADPSLARIILNGLGMTSAILMTLLLPLRLAGSPLNDALLTAYYVVIFTLVVVMLCREAKRRNRLHRRIVSGV